MQKKCGMSSAIYLLINESTKLCYQVYNELCLFAYQSKCVTYCAVSCFPALLTSPLAIKTKTKLWRINSGLIVLLKPQFKRVYDTDLVCKGFDK